LRSSVESRWSRRCQNARLTGTSFPPPTLDRVLSVVGDEARLLPPVPVDRHGDNQLPSVWVEGEVRARIRARRQGRLPCRSNGPLGSSNPAWPRYVDGEDGEDERGPDRGDGLPGPLLHGCCTPVGSRVRKRPQVRPKTGLTWWFFWWSGPASIGDLPLFRGLRPYQPVSARVQKPEKSRLFGLSVSGHLELPAGGQWVPDGGHHGMWWTEWKALRRRPSRTRRCTCDRGRCASRAARTVAS